MHVREIPDDAPDVEDARRREFRPLFDVIDEMDKHRQNIEKQYRQRNLTIGLASELMGHDILTMWAGLSQIPEAGIRCAVGNRAALDKAVQGLGDRPQLVIDPLGLITLYHLPCRDELLAFCGPLITSQSVRDEFLKIAESRRADTPQGFTTITRQKIGSGYTAVEFPAEAVAEHAAQAQALRDWVEANTQVQPVGLLLSKQGGHWKQMRNTLGEAYADPLFIAKEANLLLWTDDDALRQVAEHELGVTGVWSQVVLTRAAQTGAISGEAKEDAVIWLASRNYRYTSVSVETVVRAAEQAAWLPTPQLLSVLRVLGGEYSDLTGIPIAVEAMYELFRKKVPSLRFEALIVALVDSVTRGRNRQATLKRVSTLLSQRFYLAPIHASRIMAIIKAWTIANPI